MFTTCEECIECIKLKTNSHSFSSSIKISNIPGTIAVIIFLIPIGWLWLGLIGKDQHIGIALSALIGNIHIALLVERQPFRLLEQHRVQ